MATRPITISIQGDSSGLSKALRTAEKGVTGFAKNVGKLGIKAGAAFVAAAVGFKESEPPPTSKLSSRKSSRFSPS